MKRVVHLLLAIVTGLAVRAGEAKDDWKPVTPSGLSVECLGSSFDRPVDAIHDSCRYDHWRMAIRYRVSNPTDAPRAFTLQIYARRGWGHFSNGSRFPDNSQYLMSEGVVPAHSNVVVELRPVAMDRMFLLEHRPRLVDASGENASPEACRASGVWSTSAEDWQHCVLHSTGVDAKALRDKFANQSRCTIVPTVLRDWTRVTHWSELAGFSAVVLTSAEWSQLPDAVREILADYEAAGGLVVRNGELPTEDALKKVRNSFIYNGTADSWALQQKLKDRVPLPAILLVMLAFVVVAGPVLVFILARRDRRLHILWIFPVVACAFTLVLTVVIRLSVGTQLVKEEFASVRTAKDREVIRRSIVLFAPSAAEGKLELPYEAFVRFDHQLRSRDVPRQFTDAGRTMDLALLPPLWPVRFDIIEVKRK